jgi:7-cyano-7-deazaguanine synthase
MNDNINNTPDNKVKPFLTLFWTGGFDSTCRIIQLSRLDVIIQPYYLVDSKYRRSVAYELSAISEITKDIEKHPETRCEIKPLIKVDVSELGPSKEIYAAYKRIRQHIALGIQYEWLARFALMYPGIELCLEKEEEGHIYKLFNEKGVINTIIDREISYLVFDKTKTEKDLYTIFGNFHIPLPLWERTKFELIDEYKRLGFEKAMLKTWFCHNPVESEPCGVCNPCKLVIRDGLSFRMPPAAIKRYATEMKNCGKVWFRFWKIIRWRIFGY